MQQLISVLLFLLTVFECHSDETISQYHPSFPVCFECGCDITVYDNSFLYV